MTLVGTATFDYILRIDTGGWVPYHNNAYISETI